MAQPTILENFDSKNQLSWRIINDGVMGGISSSKMDLLPNGKGQFSGMVSLENNGGFASTRGILSNKPTKPFTKVKIRVKGDGKKYSFRIRTRDNFAGVSYKMDFVTKDAEWSEIILPLADFIPTWRGRQLRDIPPINSLNVQQIGFLISDKQAGTFSLLIDEIVLL
ncbi:MAG: CIA30 family protein [Saprospiraceae bacterium]